MARHLAPVLAVSRFAAWWWLVVTVGLGVLATSATRLPVAELDRVGTGLWLGVGLVLLGELRPVVSSTRTDPAGINLATAFCFAALLHWGLDAAVVLVALATVVGEWGRRKPVYRALFNVAQYTCSYVVAAAVLAVGGRHAQLLAPATLAPTDLPLVVAAAAAYHVTNLSLVAAAVATSTRTRWRDQIRVGLAWHTVTTAGVLALAPLIVVVLSVDAGFLPLLVLPLFLLWWTAKDALERERAAETDPLTGLGNRAHLTEVLQTRLLEGRPGVVCLLDLDGFKQVNDTFGHAVGDELLRAVAGRLRAGTRAGDVVARLGGDEFVLVLDDVTAQDAERRVSDLAGRLDTPVAVMGHELEVELSIGVAVAPADGEDVATLLRRADEAMYAAKSAGEVVRRFEPGVERGVSAVATTLAQLRTALDDGQLELHYQPQVALPSGEVRGVEALLRWRHPTRGLLAPGAFLPHARRTATLRLMTVRVLDLALDQAAAWCRDGLAVPIAVNASPFELAAPDIGQRIVRGLAARGLPAQILRVELTEDALGGTDRAAVDRTLRVLRDVGVGTSLDDFGRGASSLVRLRDADLDEVKLDRTLIAELGDGGPRDVAIVRSIRDLAVTLGMSVLAEGVETVAQWEALAELGCDAAQGYLIAYPLSADDATTWLRQRLRDPATAASGSEVGGR